MKANNNIKALALAALVALAGAPAYAQPAGGCGQCAEKDGKQPAASCGQCAGDAGKQSGPRKADAKKWQDRVQSDRIAFLTAEMDLSPEEAQAFWPIYNQASTERREAFKRSGDALKALRQAVDEGKPDAEIQSKIKDYTDALEANRSKDYTQEYLKVLPASKVAKLYLAEEKFRQRQIRCLGDGGKGGRAPGEFAPGRRDDGPAPGDKAGKKAKK